MAKWTSYFKIIKPADKRNAYQRAAINQFTMMPDGQDVNTAAFSTFTQGNWAVNSAHTPMSRMMRYKQYENMDNGDIARALDILGEEISNPDEGTGLPFRINYLTEENQRIEDAVVITVRAALRHFSSMLSLNKRIFQIARQLIKYGDIFFVKTSDMEDWEYVHPSRVIDIGVDPKTLKPLIYHIRPSAFKKANMLLRTAGQQFVYDEANEFFVVPADAVVHFSMSDIMGDSAPFGMSILQNSVRDWQKLMLLEESAVIYRLVRAPERRAFYIDTGSMPPNRIKQYLETIKNEMRQNRIPNPNGNGPSDGTYNAECLDLQTRIPLLDGRTLTLNEIILEYQDGKQNWVYSCNPETGEVVPGPISWAGVTRKNTKRIKLTFDNGQSVICTPDHKFPIRDKGFVEAQNIAPNDSLFPFATRKKVMYKNSDYEQVWDNNRQEWVFTHRLVDAFINGAKEDGAVIHHMNFKRFDNSPFNLVRMPFADHNQYHRDVKANWWNSLSEEEYMRVCNNISDGVKTAIASYSDEKMDKMRKNHSISQLDYFERQRKNPTKEYINWKKTCGDNIRNYGKSEDAKIIRSLNGKTVGKNNLKNKQLYVSQNAFSRLISLINLSENKNRQFMKDIFNSDEQLLNLYKADNHQDNWIGTNKINTNKLSDKYLNAVYKFVGVSGWEQLVEIAPMYNHKIVHVEVVEDGDTGTITVDQNEEYHDFHTYALECGVFTKNSMLEDYFFATNAAGRGSRVEPIQTSASWEIPELDYFLNKVFRSMRVPLTYMRGQESGGAQANDGKVGIAYIEELRFANYCRRIQTNIEEVFDAQFKTYLSVVGLNIDTSQFQIKLPEPQNFALYRQSALDSDLINTFKSVEDIKYISRRFALKKYLGLTEEEIQLNEVMLKQELGIKNTAKTSDLTQMYSPAYYDNMSKPEDGSTDGPETPEMGGGPISSLGGPSDAAPPDDTAPPDESDADLNSSTPPST